MREVRLAVPLTEAELEWVTYAFRTYDVSSLTTEEIREVEELREKFARALEVKRMRRHADYIERNHVLKA